MLKFRSVLLKAASNQFAAGVISRDELTQVRRFVFLFPWKVRDLRDRVAGLAQAEGAVDAGIDWDSIPWDEIIAFIEKLVKIIIALIAVL